MIILKKLMMALSTMACLSMVAYATDEEESSLESNTSSCVSFFDPYSVTMFLKKIVENDRDDPVVMNAFKYVKKNNKIRVSDREIVVNCLIQKNKFDEAANFLWYTLTALEGCDKDLFNYYRTILPDTIEIQRPENLENKERFKVAVMGCWQGLSQIQAESTSRFSWLEPSLGDSEIW